jgi:hypothetical protein
MCTDIHLLRNDADIHFLRNDQNPRWDVGEAERNWLCRALRFDADVGSLRVICRIPFRDFVSAFGPIPDENVFEVFEKHRAKIEDAAREIILSGNYTSDIAWGDPDTASILMTCPNIQRAL